MRTLTVEDLPLPPSTNKLYYTKGGIRHLSAAGKIYHHKVKIAILSSIAFSPDFMEGLDTPLSLDLTFYFTELENKGWLQGKAKSRYKRVDLSNRVKVLEDAIAEALCIDDKLFFSITLRKMQRPREGVRVIITKTPESDYILET